MPTFPRLSRLSPSVIPWLSMLAILSMFTTLHLPYIGEESVYAISTQEMWYYDSWIKPLLFGSPYTRPPLFNWVILVFTHWLGIDQVMIAARLAAITMTALTSLVLYWLMQQLTKERTLALLSVAIYLSGDLLLRRGWLAYADPAFAFFCFSSCALLWVSVHNQRIWMLALAYLALNAGFLSKAITVYVFFFATQAVLVFHPPYRAFLKQGRVLFLQVGLLLCGLILPISWHILLEDPEQYQSATVLVDILNQFSFEDVSYFKKLLVFPLDVWLRFWPTSLIVLFFLFRGLSPAFNNDNKRILKFTAAIVLVNILPYWIAPQMRIRYLLPLYPFIAMFLACLIWQLKESSKSIKCLTWVTRGLLATIVLRVALGLFWFPYYELRYRGDAKAVAEDMVAFAGEKPIYCNYASSFWLNVIAYANTARFKQGKPPIIGLNEKLPKGLFLTNTEDYREKDLEGKLEKTYILGRTPLYLHMQY